jgi:hypothetical protein
MAKWVDRNESTIYGHRNLTKKTIPQYTQANIKQGLHFFSTTMTATTITTSAETQVE